LADLPVVIIQQRGVLRCHTHQVAVLKLSVYPLYEVV
jgi:hypothetical protein